MKKAPLGAFFMGLCCVGLSVDFLIREARCCAFGALMYAYWPGPIPVGWM